MDSSVTPLRHGGLSLVQTTDFFYPLVDDPYMMGKNNISIISYNFINMLFYMFLILYAWTFINLNIKIFFY